MTTPTRVETGTEHVREPLLRHLVGAILRRARLRQGRTLQEVSATARMSTAYLSEVERGRKEASSEVLAAVCGALGIRLVDLVGQAHDALAATIEQQAAGDRRVRVLTSVGRRVVDRASVTSRTAQDPREALLLAA
ncbi:helix-turn-helix domain-containing protein [Isoptericola sp. NEAU-Y5]|uniref:Helix-turn-helix domain-containing protein n=1 Tax=Isoptericola luteus TaxID=2879484 RepID=A0ABS7ZGB6_9MICO|nr:helix-turn-helix transcriptional regulator [Isoptericola sp. NEAU-Y5]MCA5892850.1 helix-turn-helix domain-containing protein [Isoptericola sp. NEAU-Y5]